MNSNIFSFHTQKGIPVVAEQLPWTRSVLISIWIKGGSRDERPQHYGISHLVEHLVFKGTRSRKIHHIATGIESVGGYINAMTDKEYTCFYARVPSDHLTKALDILTDLVFFPVIDAGDLEKERQVVLDELMGAEDNPEDFIGDWFEDHLFTGTGLGHPVIGYRETVQSISKDDCQRLVDFHHQTNRVLITVTGNFQVNKLERELNRLTTDFKSLPLEGIQPETGTNSRQPNKTFTLTKPISQSHIMSGFRGPGVKEPDSIVQLLVSNVLGGGMSSRLNLRIREKVGYCYNIYSAVNFYNDTSSFFIYAATEPSKFERLQKLINRELDKLQNDSITDRELAQIKKSMTGSLIINAESVTGRHQSMARSILTLDRYQTLDEQREEIEAVSHQDIRNYLGRFPVTQQEVTALILGSG